MSARRDDLDAHDLVARYRGGASLHALSKQSGVDRYVIRRVLREHGIDPRSKSEAIRLLRRAVDVDALAARYVAGESAKSLSRASGIDERAVARALRDAGVALRSNADANRLRARRMTPDEHRLRSAQFAHAWTTSAGAPVFTPDDPERIAKAATARARTCAMQQPDELRVLAMLPHGWADSQQLAVDGHNLDFAHGSVAVEVHSAAHYPFRAHRLASRAVDLAERGWHVAYIWITKRHSLTQSGVAELVANVERLDSGPPLPRQYVVIRGGGEVVSAGRLDTEQRAIVPTTEDP